MIKAKKMEYNRSGKFIMLDKLLRLYRANECLWNPRSSGYFNAALQENAWQRISSFFDNKYSIEQLKLTIHYVRDYYHRAGLDRRESENFMQSREMSIFEELEFLDNAPTMLCNSEGTIETQPMLDHNPINSIVEDTFLLSELQNRIPNDIDDSDLPTEESFSKMDLFPACPETFLNNNFAFSLYKYHLNDCHLRQPSGNDYDYNGRSTPNSTRNLSTGKRRKNIARDRRNCQHNIENCDCCSGAKYAMHPEIDNEQINTSQLQSIEGTHEEEDEQFQSLEPTSDYENETCCNEACPSEVNRYRSHPSEDQECRYHYRYEDRYSSKAQRTNLNPTREKCLPSCGTDTRRRYSRPSANERQIREEYSEDDANTRNLGYSKDISYRESQSPRVEREDRYERSAPDSRQSRSVSCRRSSKNNESAFRKCTREYELKNDNCQKEFDEEASFRRNGRRNRNEYDPEEPTTYEPEVNRRYNKEETGYEKDYDEEYVQKEIDYYPQARNMEMCQEVNHDDCHPCTSQGKHRSFSQKPRKEKPPRCNEDSCPSRYTRQLQAEQQSTEHFNEEVHQCYNESTKAYCRDHQKEYYEEQPTYQNYNQNYQHVSHKLSDATLRSDPRHSGSNNHSNYKNEQMSQAATPNNTAELYPPLTCEAAVETEIDMTLNPRNAAEICVESCAGAQAETCAKCNRKNDAKKSKCGCKSGEESPSRPKSGKSSTVDPKSRPPVVATLAKRKLQEELVNKTQGYSGLMRLTSCPTQDEPRPNEGDQLIPTIESGGMALMGSFEVPPMLAKMAMNMLEQHISQVNPFLRQQPQQQPVKKKEPLKIRQVTIPSPSPTPNPFQNINYNLPKGQVIVLHPPDRNFRPSKNSCNINYAELQKIIDDKKDNNKKHYL